VAVVVFGPAALPRGILCDSERIGNDVRTKDRLLRQHAKIVRLRHFSEYLNVFLKFRTHTVFDPRPGHEGQIFLRIFGVPEAL
jgi:hypothetical protein